MKKLFSIGLVMFIIIAICGVSTSRDGVRLNRAIAMEQSGEDAKIMRPPAPPPTPVFPDIPPNDTNFNQQWNLFNDGQMYQGMETHFGIQVLKAWKYVKDQGKEGGNGVKIAILSSGIAYENYTLKNGKTIIRDYKKAPDFVNTIFDTTNARDFTTSVVGTHANDDLGIGTEMCGVIAASTNNGKGSVGIAYKSTILPIRTHRYGLNPSWTGIHNAIKHAADCGANVIVLNYVGNDPAHYSEEGETLVHDAITYAHEKGAVIIVPTFNYINPEYPGWISYFLTDETIHVGSARIDGTRPVYPQYNSEPLLEILAPVGSYYDLTGDGTYMEKTLYESFDPYPPYGTGSTYTFNQNFQYVAYEHFNVSVAEVAAVAALVISIHPTWTPEEVKTAILASGKMYGTNTGYTAEYGWGALDAFKAVTYTP